MPIPVRVLFRAFGKLLLYNIMIKRNNYLLVPGTLLPSFFLDSEASFQGRSTKVKKESGSQKFNSYLQKMRNWRILFEILEIRVSFAPFYMTLDSFRFMYV